MRIFVLIIGLLMGAFSFSQEEEALMAQKKADNYVHEGNKLVEKSNLVSAEMAYRKALSQQPTSVSGLYNLGNTLYEDGYYDEAFFHHQQAAKTAISKPEKHKAFHNLGNALMKGKKCKAAVEAYKNALRNDPSDDETRYNLALAKQCAEQQQDNQDDKEDKDQDKKQNEDEKEDDKGEDKESNKENKDQEEDNKEDGKDKEEEKEDSKDKKEDKGKDGDKKPEPKQPKPGQLSPQQIKSLLEAMDNQEQKVQEKVNAEKLKGVKIQTEKDW